MHAGDDVEPVVDLVDDGECGGELDTAAGLRELERDEQRNCHPGQLGDPVPHPGNRVGGLDAVCALRATGKARPHRREVGRRVSDRRRHDPEPGEVGLLVDGQCCPVLGRGDGVERPEHVVEHV